MSTSIAAIFGNSLQSILSGQTRDVRPQRNTHAVDQALEGLIPANSKRDAEVEVREQFRKLTSEGLGSALFQNMTLRTPEPTGRSPGPFAGGFVASSDPASEPRQSYAKSTLVDVFA